MRSAVISVKLLSMSNDAQKNVNGTEYKVCGIELKTKNGITKRVTGIMYKKSYTDHDVEIGMNYRAEAFDTAPGKDPLIVISHLPYVNERAKIEDFDFVESEETVSEKKSINVSEKLQG